jgi:thioredoxin reductase
MRDLYRFLSGPAYARRYVASAKKKGVEIATETTITGWQSNTLLRATQPDGLAEIRASAVVLATGCRERPRAARMIPGSRPSGIFTTGSLQNFVNVHHLPVGRRALVVGADHVGFSAVMTLEQAGVEVLAMVTDLPRHQSSFLFKLVSTDRYRVPIQTDMKVTEIQGKDRVEGVELTHTKNGSVRQVECDTIVFTGNWIPDYELSFSGGIEIDSHSQSPRINPALQTSVEGVFATGNLVHAAETADIAALSGRRAARAVKAYLSTGNWVGKESIPIEFAAPILWISPASTHPGLNSAPNGHFTLRVAEIVKRPLLRVLQGNRVLWQKRYRSMTPNLPVHVSDAWLALVKDCGEPVRLELAV